MMLRAVDILLLTAALTLMGVGCYWGLWLAPAETYMGDVYRIIYVHVPSAWAAMLAFTVSFAASVVYLYATREKADAIAEASAEVGLVFCLLLLTSGAIWGRPTWGVWWTWDPRLTTAAIMFFAYAGYLALRSFVEEPEKRATWSAVIGIIIYVDIPIVWFSVKWWKSLHQVQSDTGSMSWAIAGPLLICVAGFGLAYLFFLRQRYLLARCRQALEASEPPER